MESGQSTFGYTDGDVDTNVSANPSLNELVADRYSRRQTLFGGLGATVMALFGTSMLTACGDENVAPVVSAGQNGTSTSGRIVTLVGMADDSDGIGSVSWTQTGGPDVTLIGADSNSATFLAPSVAAATALTFRFSATDSKGASTSADTTVTVSPATLGFTAVAKNLSDIVTVPAGYTVGVLYRLGDPLATGVSAYANDGTDSNFAQRAGDHHDGIHFFGLNSSGARDDASNTRGLLVMNHENITQDYLHPAGPTSPGGVRPESEATKEIECHGVSIVEVSQSGTAWSYAQGSSFNRRITPSTPTMLTGPVAGNALVKTLHSPMGTGGRGTINNCAIGYTPWGTYLTCEENWAFYFKRPTATDNPARLAAGGNNPKSVTGLARYGVTSGSGNYGWTTVSPASAGNTLFARWNAAIDTTNAADGTGDFRNEPNQFGWVVEIDPYDPTSTPRKRTALGRMGHEGCWPSRFVAGVKPAFYMGDDSRNEYLYKFVSASAWSASDANQADRLAMGDKYMNSGTLYVANFNSDGSGTWLPLVFGQGPLTSANATYPFADQADVLVHARLAADAVGATKMDRPEWTAINPETGEMYLTLTNTNASSRPLNATDAANPRHYNDPKNGSNQFGNPNGHIIRLRETGDTSEATTFTWDIYAFGAGADLDPVNINVSGLDATNDFSSPDGLWFGRPSNASGQVAPVLWIQTDDGAYTDVINCMMLAAMPGTVGDGSAKTITNKDSTGATATQNTLVGAAPGTTLRRFLVGPKECEITGVDTTPDGRTIFVNIQHPGENGSASTPTSNWPASQSGGNSGRPRS
ncbi:MAG: alkaline phosphatase PhoX, partial [Thiohalobacteraceae bacterium]